MSQTSIGSFEDPHQARAIAIAIEILSPAREAAAPAIKALRDQLGRALRNAHAPQTKATRKRASAPRFRPLKKLRLPGLS